jgi:hypothetical protein
MVKRASERKMTNPRFRSTIEASFVLEGRYGCLDALHCDRGVDGPSDDGLGRWLGAQVEVDRDSEGVCGSAHCLTPYYKP